MTTIDTIVNARQLLTLLRACCLRIERDGRYLHTYGTIYSTERGSHDARIHTVTSFGMLELVVLRYAQMMGVEVRS